MRQATSHIVLWAAAITGLTSAPASAHDGLDHAAGIIAMIHQLLHAAEGIGLIAALAVGVIMLARMRIKKREDKS